MRFAVGASLMLLLSAALLAGCNNRTASLPAPLEPTAESASHFCGMLLVEHDGPKGQIFLKGRSQPVWFSSVGETVAFTMLPDESADVAAIYVNDMARAKNWEQPEPGTWVEARRAWYVIGSDKRGAAGMGDIRREPIPFGEEAAARRFQEAHGGRVVRFAEIPPDDILGSGAGAGDRGPVRSELDPSTRAE
jgi:copper chaperone NosL